MVIVFLLYFITLVWLLNYKKISNGEEKKYSKINEDLTIIIKNINDLDGLLITLECIQKQDYNLDKVDIILLNQSTHDIEPLLDIFNNIFHSIKIINIPNCERLEYLKDINIDRECNNQVLLINNRSIISESYFKSLFNYIMDNEDSMLLLPSLINSSNKFQIFNQIYFCFIEAIKSSLWNKHLITRPNLFNGNFLLNKGLLKKYLEGYEVNKYFILAQKLCIYTTSNEYTSYDRVHYAIERIHLTINLLFIMIMIQFITDPSIYLLSMMIIKSFPELCFIYIYYNQLDIKFPKVEVLIYSIINPFYSLIKLLRYSKR